MGEDTAGIPAPFKIGCPLFFLNDPPTTEISPLPLPAALRIWGLSWGGGNVCGRGKKGVESGRRVKASHRGGAPASYWRGGGSPRIPSMFRRRAAGATPLWN